MRWFEDISGNDVQSIGVWGNVRVNESLTAQMVYSLVRVREKGYLNAVLGLIELGNNVHGEVNN